VLLLTPEANDSSAVLQEVESAHTERKRIHPVIVRGTQPSDELLFYVRALHRIPWTEARTVAAAVARVFPLTDTPRSASDLDAERRQQADAARQAEERRPAAREADRPGQQAAVDRQPESTLSRLTGSKNPWLQFVVIVLAGLFAAAVLFNLADVLVRLFNQFG
jgi:hypothetical protein